MAFLTVIASLTMTSYSSNRAISAEAVLNELNRRDAVIKNDLTLGKTVSRAKLDENERIRRVVLNLPLYDDGVVSFDALTRSINSRINELNLVKHRSAAQYRRVTELSGLLKRLQPLAHVVEDSYTKFLKQ